MLKCQDKVPMPMMENDFDIAGKILGFTGGGWAWAREWRRGPGIWLSMGGQGWVTMGKASLVSSIRRI
jgi:hypothetical protein